MVLLVNHINESQTVLITDLINSDNASATKLDIFSEVLRESTVNKELYNPLPDLNLLETAE